MNPNVLARICAVVFFISVFAGCTTRQHITKLESPKPKQVCIVQHQAVRPGVLEAIQEGLSRHGMQNRVVNGAYEQKHAMWHPRFSPEQVSGCDALLFYVANWSWDLALYMRFANIWMTARDGTKRIAQATYDAGGNIGPGKFIVARDKILELVDQMMGGPGIAQPPSSPTTSKVNVQNRLEQLEDLKKNGLVSEQEYQKKREEILNEL